MARDHLGMAERLDIAVALQLLFVDIHRARDIDRKDQLEIDLGIGGPRRQREDQETQDHAYHHGIASVPPPPVPDAKPKLRRACVNGWTRHIILMTHAPP